MSEQEYLVSYGSAGEFGRFRAVEDVFYQRGDRVVIRSHQGVEFGVVMCPATPGHSQFLSKTMVGELLRAANEEDERRAEVLRERSQRLFDEGRRLAADLSLPLEIIDVEMLLDGQRAIIYHLRAEDCDYRPLVSTLSKQHDILLRMENLAMPRGNEEENGCGRPDCGRTNGKSGCSTCGTANGCGTCARGTNKEEVAAYLAMLHERTEGYMEERRVSLL